MKRKSSSGNPAHQNALLAAAITLLILLPAWIWLGKWYQASLVRQERANAREQISSQANSLIFAVNQRITLLEGLYAFTRTEWPGNDFDFPFEVFSSELYFKSTGVRTLMIAPQGIARYIYPIFDARKLSGYDVINDPDQAIRQDVQRAIHARQITLSQPAELPQGGFGVTAWRAVFRGTDLWGLVSISVDVPTILDEIGMGNPSNPLLLALRDNSGKSFFGPDEVWEGDPLIETIILPDGTWELGGIPLGGWNSPIASQVALFRFGSLLLVVFLAGIIYLVVNRQDQLAHMAVLNERQRLARDLHDSVSQVLYSIGLGVRSARTALERDPLQVGSTLDYISRLAEGGQVEMRALIFELSPESLRTEGLVVALERQASVLRMRYQVKVESQLCPEPDLPLTVKEAIYRVAQEAMHNIVKHGHASRVELSLECADKKVVLVVNDDGVGFDMAADQQGHMGLRSMLERATRNNGQLTINSQPGQGTRIELRLPLK
jgi:signal transduction histidine kinase